MASSQILESLRQSVPAILPSLLACDFGNLAAEIERVEAAGAAGVHLDVMDGHFVPNLTFGIPILQAVRRLTRLPVDVHLMIADPRRYLKEFRDAGADLLTFHVEAVDDPRLVLEETHGLGMAAGIAINPDTPLGLLEGCLDRCDFLLMMSVPAGFGGQPFRHNTPDRLRRVRELADERLLLEVDGGINIETIGACSEAGAQLFVVGSALFRNPPYGEYIEELRRAVGASSAEA